MHLSSIPRHEIFEYFSKKRLEELTIEELAYTHLEVRRDTRLKNCSITSSLADLVESLSASFSNNRTNQYVPLLTSFAILDQIGCLYENKNKHSKYQNGIKRSLDYFSDFPSTDLDTLVTMRHGLVHDGSLSYINRDTQTAVIFRMAKDKGKVISHPRVKWDGVYRDDLTDYLSLVDLRELQNVVAEVIAECKKQLLKGNLSVSISDKREFVYKYLFPIV